MIHLRRFAVVAVLGLLGVSPAEAQVSIDVAPLAGFYAATTDYPSHPTGPIPFGPDSWKQSTAFAYGGQATVWLGSLGFMASYMRASSNVEVQAGTGVTDTTYSGSLRLATAQVLLSLHPGTLDSRFYLAGGVGRVMRRGKVFDDLKGTDATGAAIGAGSRIPLGSRLGIDLGLQTFIYKLQIESDADTFKKTTQIDLVGRVGVVVRLL